MKKVKMKELEGLTSEQKGELLKTNGYVVEEGYNKDGHEEGTYTSSIYYKLYNEDDEEIHVIVNDMFLKEIEGDEPIVLRVEWEEIL